VSTAYRLFLTQILQSVMLSVMLFLANLAIVFLAWRFNVSFQQSRNVIPLALGFIDFVSLFLLIDQVIFIFSKRHLSHIFVQAWKVISTGEIGNSTDSLAPESATVIPQPSPDAEKTTGSDQNYSVETGVQSEPKIVIETLVQPAKTNIRMRSAASRRKQRNQLLKKRSK
jgi:hypothetical protein